MRITIELLGAGLLASSFAGSTFIPKQSLFTWVSLLLLLSLALSVVLGAYWASRLMRIDAEACQVGDCCEMIEKAMRKEARWLQAIRPNFQSIGARGSAESSIKVEVRRHYMSTAMLGISLLVGGALVSISMDPFQGRGLFGSLLETGVGRAIAITFCVHLFLSSASAYLAGVFFKSRDRSQV